MANSVEIDLREVLGLAADLSAAPATVLREARAVTQKAALNIKNQMRAEAQGVGHAPALPGDITYETAETAGGISAVIGPTTGDVGSLALLYFGNSKTGPRLPDPVHALEAEMPAFEKYLSQIGADPLES